MTLTQTLSGNEPLSDVFLFFRIATGYDSMDDQIYSLLASTVGIVVIIGTLGSVIAPWLATKITCKNRGDMYPEGHKKKAVKS